MRDADWAKFVARGYGDFKFNILVGDTVVPLAVPAGQSADKYFSSRISATNPNALYLSVNLAITDAPYTGVQPPSRIPRRTCTRSIRRTWPRTRIRSPGAGPAKQRGFFLFGDGSKNAEFSSPDAVYVTLPKPPGDLNGDGVANCADLALAKKSMFKRAGQPGYDARADVTGDGAADINDWTLITSVIPVTGC